jgi:hypothetical protein
MRLKIDKKKKRKAVIKMVLKTGERGKNRTGNLRPVDVANGWGSVSWHGAGDTSDSIGAEDV